MKTKQNTRAAKAAPNAKTVRVARTYAAKVNKEFGPCTVVRAVAQKYPSLRRRDVLSVTTELGINEKTAARQFFLTRSGAVRIEKV